MRRRGQPATEKEIADCSDVALPHDHDNPADPKELAEPADQLFVDDVFMRSYDLQMATLGSGWLLSTFVYVVDQSNSPLAMKWPYLYFACMAIILAALRQLLKRHKRSMPAWGSTAVSYIFIGSYCFFMNAAFYWACNVDLSAVFDSEPERIWDSWGIIW